MLHLYNIYKCWGKKFLKTQNLCKKLTLHFDIIVSYTYRNHFVKMAKKKKIETTSQAHYNIEKEVFFFGVSQDARIKK